MGVKLNLIDKTFNRLTVISYAGSNKHNKTVWLCRCICGNKVIVTGSHLINGNTNSCGCYQVDRIKEAETTHGQAKAGEMSKEYKCWANMKNRCYNKKVKQYKDYGGRGIMVCDRWLNSFDNFFFDMGKMPTDKHSIERIDNNKGYAPENCKWDTKINQARNNRRNRWLEYDNKKMLLSDWAKYFGVHPSAIYCHFKGGKTFEQVYRFYENKNAA